MKRSERRARHRRTEHAASLIHHVLDGYKVSRDVREHRVVTEWRAMVGDRLAARTWPDGLRDGVLWVRVANSAWMQELGFLREALIGTLNAHLGRPPLVKELKFHLGARRATSGDDAVAALAHRLAPRPRTRKRKFAPATDETLQTIERETSAVEDDELRAALRDFRRRIGM